MPSARGKGSPIFHPTRFVVSASLPPCHAPGLFQHPALALGAYLLLPVRPDMLLGLVAQPFGHEVPIRVVVRHEISGQRLQVIGA